MFSFGGGGSGLSEEAWGVLTPVFSFEYMGAAEYEFGSLPRALFWMTAPGDVVSFKFTLSGKKIAPHWRRRHEHQMARLKEIGAAHLRLEKVARAKKPDWGIPDQEIGVICREPHREEIKDRIIKLAAGKLHVRDATHLDLALDPQEERDRETCGWIEIDNGYMFFLDLDMWQKASGLFLQFSKRE